MGVEGSAGRHEHARDLLWVFFTRDLKVRYQRSVLGVLWSLAYPLVQLVVYGFMFKRVLGVRTEHYASYAFSGILMWSYMAQTLSEGTRVITDNRELVRHPGFPLTLLPVSVLMTSTYQLLVSLPVLLVCLAFDGLPLGPHLMLVFPVLVAQALLTLGLLFFFASLNVVFRDVEHIVAMLLTVAMFINPVFWERSLLPDAYLWVHDWNPVALLLEAYRTIMLAGQAPRWGDIASIVGISLALLALGRQVFARMSNRFAEEL